MLRELGDTMEKLMSIWVSTYLFLVAFFSYFWFQTQESRNPVGAKAKVAPAIMPSYSGRSPDTTVRESVSKMISKVGRMFNALDEMGNVISTPMAGSGTQAPSTPSSSSANPTQLADPIARLGAIFSASNASSRSSHPPVLTPSSTSTLQASSEGGLNLMDMGRKSITTNPLILQLTISRMASHMQTLTPGEPAYVYYQSNLGLFLLHLYELTWNDEHLNGGVSATTLATGAVDMHDPGVMVKYIPMLMRNWAFGFRLLVRKDGDIPKLDSAIETLRAVWNIYKDIDEKLISNYAKGLWRSELGACLFDRFCATGILMDLDDAIQHLQALSDKGHMVSYLGLAHYERFLQAGNIDDLDRALYHSRNQSQLSDVNVPVPSIFGNVPQDQDEILGRHLYGLVLAQRFNMTLDIRDLDRAIESCRNAFKALSPSHPMKSYFQADLALIFLSRFEAQEAPEDLRNAMDMIRSAVQAFENSNAGKFGRYTRVPPQAIYGYFLSIDGKMGNDPSMVEEGIRHILSSRKNFSGPPFGESRIEYYLSEAYLVQFKQAKSTTQKTEILDSVVHHATLAFEKANENSPYHFHLGLHLGNLLIMNYKLSLDQTRLHEAIAHFCSVALSSTWPSIRLDAAIKWADAADLLGGDGTIDALEIALSILPSMAWLGNRMRTQYRTLLSQQPAVANRAVIHALDAGEVAKAVSYLESGRNVLWAQALQLRSSQLTSEDRRSEEQKFLAKYLSQQQHHTGNLQMTSTDLSDRLSAKIQRLQQAGAPTELQDALTSLGGLFATAKQRMIELKGSENVARDFAAVDELKSDIVEGFMDASLHNAARRWDELRKSVDEVDGMLPSTGQALLNLGDNDLAKALEAGSIVILNTYGLRCDAIIISEKHGSVDLQHVSLPDISGEEAQAWAESLPQGLYDLGSGGISMPDFEDVFLVPMLQGLWKGIACPILDHLDLQNDKKRVWWYPTGPLAFLPIHAASPCKGDELGLPELVVSSYLPSIHSFIRAYRASKEPFRILAVGQPNTPGHAPLPYANKEIKMIQKLTKDVPDSLTTIIGEDATVLKVMKSLPEHTALHFACHADQDQSYPFNSAFFLHDGPFHLSKIMNLDLSRVQFAFLSACLTSSGDFNLPDECIHLAAGMQFAGVRSAVATIWSVYDSAASMATSYVYKHLLKEGIESADAQNTAEALHLAMIEMKKLKVPLTCRVPFIHLGI